MREVEVVHATASYVVVRDHNEGVTYAAGLDTIERREGSEEGLKEGDIVMAPDPLPTADPDEVEQDPLPEGVPPGPRE